MENPDPKAWLRASALHFAQIQCTPRAGILLTDEEIAVIEASPEYCILAQHREANFLKERVAELEAKVRALYGE